MYFNILSKQVLLSPLPRKNSNGTKRVLSKSQPKAVGSRLSKKELETIWDEGGNKLFGVYHDGINFKPKKKYFLDLVSGSSLVE